MVAIRLEDFVDSLYLHQGESVIYINKLNYLKSREKARMGKFIVSIVNYFFCDSLLFIYGGILAFDSRDGEMRDTQQN